VIIDSRSVDSVAVYNCSAGFEIVGIDARLCLENGSWNGTEPLCKGKNKVTCIWNWYAKLVHVREQCLYCSIGNPELLYTVWHNP
jgi:hypothetical protein